VNKNYRLNLLWLLVMVLTFNHQTVLATLFLQSSLSVDQIYTDNLFFRDRNKQEDFGTYVGPNLALVYENPDIVLGAAYFGRALFFMNNPGQNTYLQNANILLDLPFLTKRYQGLTVKVIETMNFTPQLDPFFLSEAQENVFLAGANTDWGGSGASGGTGVLGGDLAGGGTGFGGGVFGGMGGTQGIFTQRATAFMNNAGLIISYEATPQLTPTFQYMNHYLRFFSGGFQDFMTHTGVFSLPYKKAGRLTVTPRYAYRQTDFLGESTQFGSGDRIIFHDGTLELSYALTPSLILSARGGVSFMKQEGITEQGIGPDGITFEREVGSKFIGYPIGEVTLSKTYRGGAFSLTASQQTGAGGGLAAQGTRTQMVTGRIVQDFSIRITGFLSGAYAKNDSVDGGAFNIETYRAQAGVKYVFLRWLFGTANYSYIDQQSKGAVATNLLVNQIFLSLTAVADPWYWTR
jgi:hypothetical protein